MKNQQKKDYISLELLTRCLQTSLESLIFKDYALLKEIIQKRTRELIPPKTLVFRGFLFAI